MGKNSKIEWTDHTFSPWLGCQEVSAACDNCYARELSLRWRLVEKWGPHGERKRTKNWREPLKWAKAARGAVERPRVFGGSLCDWLDNQAPEGALSDYCRMIEQTPELDWLLLTKRPQNYKKLVPAHWRDGPPPNVWLGVTCENQASYEELWLHIARIEATVRFISYEPALGPMNFQSWVDLSIATELPRPHWLICGGESGRNARFLWDNGEWDLWARTARDFCALDGIAFFMKQMPGKLPIPNDLMVREFPHARSQRPVSPNGPDLARRPVG